MISQLASLITVFAYIRTAESNAGNILNYADTVTGNLISAGNATACTGVGTVGMDFFSKLCPTVTILLFFRP